MTDETVALATILTMVKKLDQNRTMHFAFGIVGFCMTCGLQAQHPASLDTTGLNAFWQAFQIAVDHDQRKEVLSVLDYPIHESLIHDWHFSVNCDTAFYATHEHEFLDADITAANGMARYDFLFTKELKAMIARTDLDKILKEGYSRGTGAMTYLFWAKHYGYGCGSDTALHFHFRRTPAGWRLSIASV